MRISSRNAKRKLANVQILLRDADGEDDLSGLDWRRFDKGNGFVTLRSQQIHLVQGRDDFTTDHELLEIGAMAEGLVIKEPQPKIDGEVLRINRWEGRRI